jgi:hypothetical protein
LVAVRKHRPMAVWGGRTGQTAFAFLATDETRMKHGFFKARQGWHICSIASHQRTKLRQERHHRACGRKMPPRRGWNSFWFWFYKYAAPDGAGDFRSRISRGSRSNGNREIRQPREQNQFGKRVLARRRKRQPGRARSPGMSQPGGQGQFEVDERGKGRLNIQIKQKWP